MGEMLKNIPDKRIMAVDQFVSSVVKLKINNVSYSDAGVYSIVSQSDTKNLGGIQLVVTGIHSVIDVFRILPQVYIALRSQLIFPYRYT